MIDLEGGGYVLAMFNDEPLYGLRGQDGPDGSPIGSIIIYMGTKAPEDYLICDGKEYNISSYPKLAELFQSEFGTPNYFGGDGTTTFAVPDMRNLFLRGFHGESADQLSGEVGKKQDATEHIAFAISSDRTVYMSSPGTDYYEQTNVDSVPLKRINGYAVISPKENNWSHASDDMARYTSRPVNMAVLYCIKAVVSEPQEGTAGKDATINGVNTLEIVAGENITLTQAESKLTISSKAADSELVLSMQAQVDLLKARVDELGKKLEEGTLGVWWSLGMTSHTTPAPFVASASSEWDKTNAAWCAFDNSNSASSATDAWASQAADTNPWLKIDLGTNRKMNAVRLAARAGRFAYQFPKTIVVKVSTDNRSWTTIGDKANIPQQTGAVWHEFWFPSGTMQVRYVWFTDLKRDGYYADGFSAIGEVEFHILG